MSAESKNSEHIRALNSSPLFYGTPQASLEYLVENTQLITVAPNTPLLRESEFVKGLYIILSGSVRIEKKGQTQVAMLEAGNFFGEISLFGQSITATATVTSTQGFTALLVTRRELEAWFQKFPMVETDFYRNLATELCARLMSTTELLTFALKAKLD